MFLLPQLQVTTWPATRRLSLRAAELCHFDFAVQFLLEAAKQHLPREKQKNYIGGFNQTHPKDMSYYSQIGSCGPSRGELFLKNNKSHRLEIHNESGPNQLWNDANLSTKIMKVPDASVKVERAHGAVYGQHPRRMLFCFFFWKMVPLETSCERQWIGWWLKMSAKFYSSKHLQVAMISKSQRNQRIVIKHATFPTLTMSLVEYWCQLMSWASVLRPDLT